MEVKVCVGSSCYLKGAERIAAACDEKIKANGLENTVSLSGSFCTGRCNREGVTVMVDGEVFTGLTPEKFDAFFTEKILNRVKG